MPRFLKRILGRILGRPLLLIGRTLWGKRFENDLADAIAAEIVADDPSISEVNILWPKERHKIPAIAMAKSEPAPEKKEEWEW